MPAFCSLAFTVAYAKPLGVRYFGSFLAIAGAQSNVPAALTYQANNVRSHSKRAVSSAMYVLLFSTDPPRDDSLTFYATLVSCVGMGGVGGIIASVACKFSRRWPVPKPPNECKLTVFLVSLLLPTPRPSGRLP